MHLRSKNIPIIKAIGKIRAARNPIFKLSLKMPETVPTRVGPDEQPRSPARARNANIAVPPADAFSAARLKTPGQRIPTESPHNPHPIRDRTGIGEKEAIR